MPYDEEAAEQRVGNAEKRRRQRQRGEKESSARAGYGFLKFVKFGLKTGTELKIFSIQLAEKLPPPSPKKKEKKKKAKPKLKLLWNLSTGAMYGKIKLNRKDFRVFEGKNNTVVDSISFNAQYNWTPSYTFGSFDEQQYNWYTFVDIESGKTIERAPFSVVLQHVLRHREHSPDPRIAYYTQA